MVKIRVKVGGCGIKYTDEHGNERHALKTPESGAFECDDEQAARLVSLGVAAYIDKQERVQPEAAQETEQANDSFAAEENEGMSYAEKLEQMTYNELKKLAGEKGVKPVGSKKADYIAALVAAEEEADEEDDELPELSAVDPE